MRPMHSLGRTVSCRPAGVYSPSNWWVVVTVENQFGQTWDSRVLIGRGETFEAAAEAYLARYGFWFLLKVGEDLVRMGAV